MSDRVRTLPQMVAWLKRNPDQPFYTVHSGGRLLVGTRNDDGELNAWDCTVTGAAFALDRPARSSRERGTR